MVEPARGPLSSRRWFGAAPPEPTGFYSSPLKRGDEVYEALGTYAGDDDLALPGDLTRFERRVFSQNGEDGVVAEVLRRVGAPARWFVEFGVGAGHEGICVALADILGWSGLFLENDLETFTELARKYRGEPRVRTVRASVDAANVEALFADAGVPDEPDVLSIDIDGNDWWIWKAVVRYRPRLLVIEYNGNLDPTSELVKPYDADGSWDETCWFGASLGAYERLAACKGYTLVYTDLRGVNAFFLRDDLVPAFGPVAPPRRVANYDLCGARMPGDPSTKTWVDLTDDAQSADALP